MKEQNDNLEITGDLLDEYAAIQEAEEGVEPEIADDDELKDLLREIWEEFTPTQEEEYTEEDAFRDFIADVEKDWN